jgi:hypothetical protein
MLAACAPSVFAAATDIQFSGYTWFRETGNNKVFGDDQTNTSKPSIERSYLTWKLKYEDNLEGNLTLDIPMKAGNTSNSDWTTVVKYAYVDVKNLLPEDGFARVGVQPVYFAMLDKWSYPLVYKPLEDNLGLISSADLGFSLQGTLLGGLADYQLAAFGGNGYSKPTETDNNTATNISMAVYPVPGLSIRGSLYNSIVSTGDAMAKEGVSAGKWYNGVAVNYYFGPLWFMWEGVEGMKPNSTMTDSFKVSGNSKMVMWTINDRWDLGIREDIYNPDVNNEMGKNNLTDSAQDMMIYGLNYHWADDLLVQLNYSKLTYDGGNQDLGGADPFKNASSARYTQYESILQIKWSY